jgi:hypothetical protein
LRAPSGSAGGAALRPETGIYSLQGIHFDRQRFNSTAECLTAAYARRLPLEVCK